MDTTTVLSPSELSQKVDELMEKLYASLEFQGLDQKPCLVTGLLERSGECSVEVYDLESVPQEYYGSFNQKGEFETILIPGWTSLEVVSKFFSENKIS